MHRFFLREALYVGYLIPLLAAFIGILPWLLSTDNPALIVVETVELDNSHLTEASSEMGHWKVMSGNDFIDELQYFTEDKEFEIGESTFFPVAWQFNEPDFNPDKPLAEDLRPVYERGSQEVTEPVIMTTFRNIGKRSATMNAISYEVLAWLPAGAGAGAGGGGYLVPIVQPKNPINLSRDVNERSSFSPKITIGPDESITVLASINSSAGGDSDTHILFKLTLDYYDGETDTSVPLGTFSHWAGGSHCFNLDLGQCF